MQLVCRHKITYVPQVHTLNPAGNHCLLFPLPASNFKGAFYLQMSRSTSTKKGAEDWDDAGHLARSQHDDQWDQGRDAKGENNSTPPKAELDSQVTYITMSDAWLYPITYYCCFCLFEFLVVQVPNVWFPT